MLIPRPHLTLGAAALSLALVTTSVWHGMAAPQRTGDDRIDQKAIELVLPRQPNLREAVWLEISIGNLSSGSIRVLTGNGELIGAVSPFGRARSQAGLTYKLPLPRTAIVDGRVRLCLEVDEPGMPPRAPKAGEVNGVMLIYVPVSE